MFQVMTTDKMVVRDRKKEEMKEIRKDPIAEALPEMKIGIDQPGGSSIP